jgi:membrane fusion protein, heavy metal efflux system
VWPELFNGSEVSAVVKTVDRVIDAASNTFRVRLELPNADGKLPAGLRCKVDLGLNLPGRAALSPAAAPVAAPPAGMTPVVQRR